ncbi:expressed unknown protein [Seminavis robusta]|uniref:Uncharacterized protein n=1 Tax=Seminavis robusta TaxID=568900 RepID=A0A9N8HVK0_9STRA|nr:expressed unknown protein [Seminavis robusta]|eukprot:Sro2352_g324410.1 n/a (243) ;mRNA; f:5325-6053
MKLSLMNLFLLAAPVTARIGSNGGVAAPLLRLLHVAHTCPLAGESCASLQNTICCGPNNILDETNSNCVNEDLSPCEASYTCIDGTCQENCLHEGESNCGAAVNGCCVGSECMEDGICKSSFAVAEYVSLGGSCNDLDLSCADGLICEDNVCKELFHPGGFAREGEICDNATGAVTPCEEHLVCGESGTCELVELEGNNTTDLDSCAEEMEECNPITLPCCNGECQGYTAGSELNDGVCQVI